MIYSILSLLSKSVHHSSDPLLTFLHLLSHESFIQNHCHIDEQSPPSSRQQQRRGSVVPSRAQSLTEQEMRINLEVPSFPFPGFRRGSGNHLMVPDDDDGSLYLVPPSGEQGQFDNRPTSPTSTLILQQMHSQVRRHRSLPSPGFINQATEHANQTRSSSFRSPVSSQIFTFQSTHAPT